MGGTSLRAGIKVFIRRRADLETAPFIEFESGDAALLTLTSGHEKPVTFLAVTGERRTALEAELQEAGYAAD